jgi:hypothetical protein
VKTNRGPGLGLGILGCCFTIAGSVSGQDFQEVSLAAGIDHYCYDPHRVCGGVAFFDYNGDGLEDLYLTGGGRADRLFRNKGDGTFADATEDAGLTVVKRFRTVGVVTGDVDSDGDRDLFVTTGPDQRNVLLRNNGDGTFSDVSEQAGITGTAWSTSATFGDYDIDGDLDLYVGNYATYDGLPYDEHLTGGLANQLYRNRGDGTFEEVAAEAFADNSEGLTIAVAFADLNGDFEIDLYVANDFGQLFLPNALLINEASSGAFSDVGKSSGTDADMNGMGIAIGDYDEDGDFDLYVSNMDRNRLFENRSESGSQELRFQDVSVEKGVADSLSTSWGTAFFDYDNDSHLDLFVANGRVLPTYNLADPRRALRLIQQHVNRVYRGAADRSLTEVTTAGIADSARGRGLAFADYDADGDLDLFVAVVSKDEKTTVRARLYRNEVGTRNHWLKVDLRGTESIRDAFGSVVRAVSGDRSWLRIVDGGSSYLSQSSSVVHFGLGNTAAVDSLIVTWPGGKREAFADLRADQTVRIVEGTSASYAESGGSDADGSR